MSGSLLQLKIQRQNLKKKFFESTYPEWLAGALKKANNDEKLLLDEIQIFVGKWQYGTFTEYLDKDKKFRRQTKLKKLGEIGEDKVRLVNGIIPEFNVDIDNWDVNNVPPVNIDGTIRVTNMNIGGGLLFTGEVDKNNIPVGEGIMTHRGKEGDEVLFKGNFGPGGTVNLVDNNG